jgi:hypothetical protein
VSNLALITLRHCGRCLSVQVPKAELRFSIDPFPSPPNVLQNRLCSPLTNAVMDYLVKRCPKKKKEVRFGGPCGKGVPQAVFILIMRACVKMMWPRGSCRPTSPINQYSQDSSPPFAASISGPGCLIRYHRFTDTIYQQSRTPTGSPRPVQIKGLTDDLRKELKCVS